MSESPSTALPVEQPGGTAAATPRAYNRFLDFVRTVAILRVLAWHTYGFAWLSYLVASMPAMFFVAGSLMAQSLQRGSSWRVLRSRFRRLLIPLWAYGAIALGIMVFHAQVRPGPTESVEWWQPIFWLVPIWDPQGSDWGITFWAVLWYMRCLTWLILLSPLLFWLFRRYSIIVIGLPLGLLAVFEQRARAGDPVPWQVEDAALFSIFWLLGFAYNGRVLSGLSNYARGGLTIGFAFAAALWVTTQDVPDMVVNASYPAHLLVGLAWLFAALTFEKPLNMFASSGIPARFVAWVNDRSFTIYLWHAAGLFAMFEILWKDEHPDWARNLFALPIVLVVTFTCMIAFGWIEDLAARRQLHLTPRAGASAAQPARRRTAWVMPLVATAGMGVLFAAVVAEVFNPPATGANVVSAIPPSGVGISIRASQVKVLDRPPDPGPPPALDAVDLPPITGGDLQHLLDQWREESAVEGVTMAIRRAGDGASWEGASGVDVYTDEPITPGYVYGTASVTKTFTAAIVLQLVEEGKVGLDEKASEYVPGIAHSNEYTVRNLIQHTSGLMATDAVAPADALLAATREPLAFEPGTGFLYSSPGYFMLGLLIEKVTGVSYTQALHERLLDPLALTSTAMDEEIAPLEESTHPISNPALRSSSGVLRSSSRLGGSVTPAFEYHGILWSSAGLQSTVGNLAAWAIDYWDPSSPLLSAATRAQMTDFLPAEFQYAGLATYPFCPCWRADDGKFVAERWGHYGRSGVLEYDHSDRVAVSIYTSGTDISEDLIVAYDLLSVRVRELLRGRKLEMAPAAGP